LVLGFISGTSRKALETVEVLMFNFKAISLMVIWLLTIHHSEVRLEVLSLQNSVVLTI
jgi:hypothetical protein